MGAPTYLAGRFAALLRGIASAEPAGLRTTDVAAAAGLPRPTAHRLLEAMNKEGLVERSDGLWFLGPDLFLLGLGAAPRYDVRNVAQPIVRRLAVVTGESASFSVRRGNETVCLLHEEGTFPLRSHVLHEGVRFPLGVASAGLVILAFLPDDERRAYLAGQELAARWGDAHSPSPLQARLASARATGVALNPGLIVAGSWGLAAPVCDRHEIPIGAISLTGIESRFGPDRLDSLGAQLLAGARELSRAIRHQTPSRGRPPDSLRGPRAPVSCPCFRSDEQGRAARCLRWA